MSLLAKLDLEQLSPAGLWSQLDGATREQAVRSVYEEGPGNNKLEADMAIAGAMRFRPGAVKQLPLERRIHYLLKNVHIDDSLALTLLLGLHLNGRADILATFLDELGIPQQGGLIDETHELQPPEPEALQRAVAAVYEKFDAPKTDLYLAALLAMDPLTWSALRDVLSARR